MVTFIVTLVLTIALLWRIKAGINACNSAAALRSSARLKYKLDQIYVYADGHSFVGLRFSSRHVVFGKGEGASEYSFAQITSVEVLENGVTVTRTNRGSQLLGGAVGALAFGPIGAVVGGLSGSTRSRTKIESRSLRVIIDDSRNPFYCIRSLSEPEIERLHAHLLNAMHQEQTTARLDAAPVANGVSRPGLDVDSLKQLWDLKEMGILSDDEFRHQKHKLLGEGDQRRPDQAPQLPASADNLDDVGIA